MARQARNGLPVQLAVPADTEALDQLVRAADVVVSVLPAGLHAAVARVCVARRVPLVTSSYVSEEMRALDGPARDAGVLILCEVRPGKSWLSLRGVAAARVQYRRFLHDLGLESPWLASPGMRSDGDLGQWPLSRDTHSGSTAFTLHSLLNELTGVNHTVSRPARPLKGVDKRGAGRAGPGHGPHERCSDRAGAAGARRPHRPFLLGAWPRQCTHYRRAQALACSSAIL